MAIYFKSKTVFAGRNETRDQTKANRKIDAPTAKYINAACPKVIPKKTKEIVPTISAEMLPSNIRIAAIVLSLVLS